MYIIPLVPATVLILAWLVLLSMATNEDWIDAAYVKVLDNRQEIEKLRRRDAARAQKLAHYHGITAKVMKNCKRPMRKDLINIWIISKA